MLKAGFILKHPPLLIPKTRGRQRHREKPFATLGFYNSGKAKKLKPYRCFTKIFPNDPESVKRLHVPCHREGIATLGEWLGAAFRTNEKRKPPHHGF